MLYLQYIVAAARFSFTFYSFKPYLHPFNYFTMTHNFICIFKGTAS